MPKLEDHPIAEIFPLMSDAELSQLADDIEANGLRDPIWLYEGKILDGRNRYRACVSKDIDHRVEHYKGKNPVAFSLSKNLHRRHLTESQRAMVAARIANILPGETLNSGSRAANLPLGKTTQKQAAEMLSVGERTVRDAVKVKDHGTPELVKAVEAGEVSVSAAAEVADLPKAEQKKAVKEGKVKEKAKEQREKKAKDKPPSKKTAFPYGANAEPDRAQQSEDLGSEEANEETTESSSTKGDASDAGDEFVKSVESLCRDYDAINARVRKLKESPFSYSIHVDSAASQGEAARKTLWVGRPDHACPYRDEGEDHKGCKPCNGTGRVKKDTYERGTASKAGARR